MMPSGGILCGTPCARELARLFRKQRGGAIIFVRHGDHREHHLEIAVRRGAQQRADLHAEDIGPRQRQPDAAQAEERIALLDGEAGHRLVAAGIDGADGDRLAAGPFQHLAVGGVLRLLVGQAGRLPNRNSVRIRPTPSQAAMSIASTSAGSAMLTCTRTAVPAFVAAERSRKSSARARRAPYSCAARRKLSTSAAVGLRHDAAMLGVEQRRAVDLDRRSAEPDHHRHAARARQHGDMARRAAGGQRDAAAVAPVGLEEAGRRDVVAEAVWRRAGSLHRRHRSSARSTCARMSLRSAARARKYSSPDTS